MSDRINLAELRKRADIHKAIGVGTPLAIYPDYLLTLIEAVEAAHDAVIVEARPEYGSPDSETNAATARRAHRLQAALARFDFEQDA